MKQYDEPDRLIHAPVRLAILSALISVKEADFNFLKEAIDTSDGNLSVHLSKLEDAGYIEIHKSFVGKRPRTSCTMTDKGREAFKRYVETIEQYLHPGDVGCEKE
ncbi:MAG: transcriptional regulator [Candidatus Marinimicrobia bacterium]|nr:transcriptional regulator [Candidatus Neomarinimicrobiota bacterium]MCF7829867.1 transcriptional regulator [Candidatus Neomarinimicrobiota bacterium]MCF7879170.1 transcriptional regulator [Candidatus Neomarinimicrobiota bacterium]